MQRTKAGSYFLRKRVPTDLVTKLAGTKITVPRGDESTFVTVSADGIVKLSFGTTDISEARRRHAEALAALEGHFEAVRQGPKSLTQKQIMALAGEAYTWFVTGMENNPNPFREETPDTGWWAYVAEQFQSVVDSATASKRGAIRIPGGTANDPEKLEYLFGSHVNRVIARHGLLIDDASRLALLMEVGKRLVQAAHTLGRRATGDYSPDPLMASFPTFEQASSAKDGHKKQEATKRQSAGYFALTTIFEKYEQSSGTREAAKRWRHLIPAFVDFIGQDDVRAVERHHARGWFDHRVSQGISPATANKTDLAAIKRILTFAEELGYIQKSPFEGVRIRGSVSARASDREGRGFHASEVETILRAALREPSEAARTSPKTAQSYRWAPWLLAYSGARPSEITQLRKGDVKHEDGIDFLEILPSAGTVKTSGARRVPLHEHLIALGFLDWVTAQPDGPLFADASSDPVKAARNVADKLGKWTRKLGVTSKDISPVHAWRHTFKTIGRESGIEENVLDAICGHSARYTGATYGIITLKTRASALQKLPRYLSINALNPSFRSYK
jgi:integrase